MINDATKFNKGVKKFLYKLENDQLIKAQKKIALDLLRKVVKRTPVDTGRARGNWQITITNPADIELQVVDKNGTETITKGDSVLKSLDKPFQIIFLTNNVPYIIALENGGSKRSPQGMLRVSMNEVLSGL